MVIIKVVAMFDDRHALQRAREDLIASGLATEETTWIERGVLGEEGSAPADSRTVWERLSEFFGSGSDDGNEYDVSAYAEGIRRGSALLVVETPTSEAEKVKDALRRHGAVDLRRRVHRWITTGWQTFDPAAPTFTELEITDEQRAAVSEADIAADAQGPDDPARTVALFDQSSGQSLGRISEAELRVLRDALEEEGPEDDNYWINREEIESITGRPGATPHLIALLRRAVGGRRDGVDIRFERTAG